MKLALGKAVFLILLTNNSAAHPAAKPSGGCGDGKLVRPHRER